MRPVISLKDEGVRIFVETDEDLQKRDVSVEGAIIRCIKHVYRYGSFAVPKDIMIAILWKAYKGCGCKEDHFDMAQRKALYQYLKDKDIDDPYVKQFLVDTEEKHKVLIV